MGEFKTKIEKSRDHFSEEFPHVEIVNQPDEHDSSVNQYVEHTLNLAKKSGRTFGTYHMSMYCLKQVNANIAE